MTRRSFQAPTLIWALALALACAHRPAKDQGPHPATTDAAPPIVDPPRRPGKPLLLVAMPGSEAYRLVRQTVVSELEPDFDIQTHVVERGTTPEAFRRALDGSGAKAVLLMNNPTVKLYRAYQSAVRGKVPPVPAILAMCSFLEELDAQLENATGVAFEVPGVSAFVPLRALIKAPVRRVGVVHRPLFASFVKRQSELARKEKIEIVAREVSAEPTAREVRKALLSLESVDALWVLNDNGLLQEGDFFASSWREAVARLGVPVVVGVETLVQKDARFGNFAVLPDLEALGVQTANLILDVADNDWAANDIPIELPVSTRRIANLQILEARFGLREGARRQVDKLVE